MRPALSAVAMRIGPSGHGTGARVEIEAEDGTVIAGTIDVAHARSFSARLDDIVLGTIWKKAPSRRVLEIAIVDVEAETERPAATGTEGPGR